METATTFLMVTGEKERFSTLAAALEKLVDADIHWADSGRDALEKAGDTTPLLAVIDEHLPDMTGLQFVKELLQKNALIYTALASTLSHDDFHEFSEGLGILVQIPNVPGEKDAEEIVSALKRVFALPS